MHPNVERIARKGGNRGRNHGWTLASILTVPSDVCRGLLDPFPMKSLSETDYRLEFF